MILPLLFFAAAMYSLKFFPRLVPQRDQQVGKFVDLEDGDEILEGVETHVLHVGRHVEVAVRAHQEGIAVGLGALERSHPYLSAAARHELHVGGLTDVLVQHAGHGARVEVVRAARAQGHDDLDGFRGILLRRGGQGGEGE